MVLSMCLLKFLEIWDQGCWKELQEVAEGKGLVSLSERAKDLVMETHASSTVKTYKSAFSRWKSWAMEHGFVAIPATPVAVSLYLIHLVETSASASPISAALSAIKWAHQKACVQLPVNAMVEQIAAAAKRRLACTPRRKEPLNKKQVATIVGQLAGSDDCLKLRTAVMFVIGFAGFMRWDDLARIRVRDIAFRRDYMEVRLDKRKNDQLREGSLVLISTQPGELGAVALTQRLIEETNLQADDHLLSNLVKAKSGWKTKKGSLQYSRARELFLEAVAGAGLQAEMFGLHSLRSGGGGGGGVRRQRPQPRFHSDC